MAAEPDDAWERPRRPRWRWLAAAAALVVAAGGAGSVIGGDDRGLTVGEGAGGPTPAAPASPSPAAIDPARVTTHTDPDHALAVAPAPGGGAWVGTYAAGLVGWDAGGERHRRRSLGAPQGAHPRIGSLAVADDGAVWAATRAPLPPVGPPEPGGRGVTRLDGQQRTTFATDDGLPDDRVRSVAIGEDGDVWVIAGPGPHVPGGDGSDGSRVPGVARFDGRRWTSWTPGEGLPPTGAVTSLAVGEDGAAWVALGGDNHPDGIARFDDGEWTAWRSGDALPAGSVESVATGADGRAWAVLEDGPGFAGPDAAEGDGGGRRPRLVRFVDGRWELAVPAADVPYYGISQLAVGADGAVWAIAWQEPGNPLRLRPRLARFDGRAWTTITRDDGLPHPEVRDVAVADDGVVWAATPRGAARTDGGGWRAYVTGEGPAGDGHAALAVAGDGTVWAGGPAGVSRLAGGEWTVWPTGGAPLGGAVRALAVADDGTVWAGTAAGVARYDGQGWTRLAGADAPDGRPVPSIAVHDGTVWAVVGDASRPSPGNGTRRAHVARYDGRRWTTWTGEAAPGPGPPVDVAVDGDGTPWVASRSGRSTSVDEVPPPPGVSRLDAGEWTSYTSDDGLPAGNVEVVDAGPRTVWAATSTGVARFTGAGWATSLPARALSEPPERPSPMVVAADDDAVWAGGGAQLAWRRGPAWVTSATTGGPPGGRVLAIAAGDERVWVATSRGLVSLDEPAAAGE